MTDDSTISYERDDDGIVTLTMDDPSSSANTMNPAYAASMRESSIGCMPSGTRSSESS